jgi:hypothetical protein
LRGDRIKRGLLLLEISGSLSSLFSSSTMPPHKLKDPFHKLKEKLSKYLEKSPSPKAAPPMATSSLFGLGLGNRSESPRSSETNSQGSSRRSSGQKMFPKELAPDLALFNNIFARLHMKCCVCDAPLSLEIDTHVAAWLAGAQVIPPTSQVSVLQCTKCDRLTCIGCGKMPKMNKRNVFTTLGVVSILPLCLSHPFTIFEDS